MTVVKNLDLDLSAMDTRNYYINTLHSIARALVTEKNNVDFLTAVKGLPDVKGNDYEYLVLSTILYSPKLSTSFFLKFLTPQLLNYDNEVLYHPSIEVQVLIHLIEEGKRGNIKFSPEVFRPIYSNPKLPRYAANAMVFLWPESFERCFGNSSLEEAHLEFKTAQRYLVQRFNKK
jgi:glycosyltransferase involved in cell wall biosynthesis